MNEKKESWLKAIFQYANGAKGENDSFRAVISSQRDSRINAIFLHIPGDMSFCGK